MFELMNVQVQILPFQFSSPKNTEYFDLQLGEIFFEANQQTLQLRCFNISDCQSSKI